MIILIFFSQCVICVPHSVGVVWVNWFCLTLSKWEPLCDREKGIACFEFYVFSKKKKKGYTKVQAIALDNLTLRTEMTTAANSDKKTA